MLIKILKDAGFQAQHFNSQLFISEKMKIRKEITMTVQKEIEELMQRARKAQKIFETYSQEEVDKIVRAIGRTVYDHAVELAELTMEETQMGTLASKISQNTTGVTWKWGHLKGKKSRGLIRHDEENRIYEIAKPMGVIGIVAPVTAPVAAPIFVGMDALKCGNAVIVSAHPKGKLCTKKTIDLVRETLEKLGAPVDLFQTVSEPTRESSAELMKAVDVIVAVGGEAVVKIAYSQGKPAFGVGPGNLQFLLDRGCDLKDAAYKMIQGRIINGGIPCTSTQFVHAPAEEMDAVLENWKAAGGYLVEDPDAIQRLRELLFPDGITNRAVVGRPATEIATAAGIEVPEDTLVLGMIVDKIGADEILAKEKLFPVTAFHSYNTWEEAVANAETNLQNEGAGHSTAIYSDNVDHVLYAAERISVCRIVVKMISSASVGGTQRCRFAPTGAVGCGTWGKNSISENLDYKHLMNITRVAYEMPESVVLSDEEIWAEN